MSRKFTMREACLIYMQLGKSGFPREIVDPIIEKVLQHTSLRGRGRPTADLARLRALAASALVEHPSVKTDDDVVELGELFAHFESRIISGDSYVIEFFGLTPQMIAEIQDRHSRNVGLARLFPGQMVTSEAVKQSISRGRAKIKD